MIVVAAAREVVAGVGVEEASALRLKDGVEAGDKHVGGMRANAASLTWASTSPGEEDLRERGLLDASGHPKTCIV